MATIVPGGLTRSNTPLPFIIFDNATASDSSDNRLTLSSGSVRIAATLFGAGPDTYIAFNINDGEITSDDAVFSTPRPPVLDVGTSTIQLTLQIAQDGPPPGSSQFVPPAPVSFTFSPTSASIQSASESTQVVLGQNFLTSLSLNPPSLDSHGRLAFPFSVDGPQINVAAGQGSVGLASVFGSASIVSATWVFSLLNQERAFDFDTAIEPKSGSLDISVSAGLLLDFGSLGENVINSARCGECEIFITDKGSAITGTTQTHTKKLMLFNHDYVQITSTDSDHRYLVGEDTEQSVILLQGNVNASMSRLADVNGKATSFHAPGSLRMTTNPSSDLITVRIGGVGTEPRTRTLPLPTYAMENLLIQGGLPTELSIEGTLEASSAVASAPPRIINGRAVVRLPIQRVQPFFPDPYTSNLTDLPFEVLPDPPNLGDFVVDMSWVDTLVISIQLPDLSLSSLQTLPTEEDDPEKLQSSNKIVFNTGPHPPGLLDLSTNASQLGVEFLRDATSPAADGVTLQISAAQMSVTALPPVSWEPVFTQPGSDGAFPSTFLFPSDGTFVRIATKAVTLTEMAPEPSLALFKEAYDKFPSSSDIDARFTLPFGLVAYAKLHRRQGTLPILIRPPTIEFVEPSFRAAGFEGMRQVSLRAPRPPFGIIGGTNSVSQHLPGFAVDIGQASDGTSIWGSHASNLDQDFGPSATARHRPLVPATRVDISGFGESMNSQWFDQTEPPPATQRVEFNTYVGRVQRTLVEQVYEIIHCGAKAIRTVTMTRQNNGIVDRTNVLSPGSEGLFEFENPDIVTNSGLVVGYFNLRNLRDGPGPTVEISGFEFAPILYDADVEISTDAGPQRFPVFGHQGFISLTKSTPSFGPQQYADLLAQHGNGIGGPVDISIRQNNLMIHISSISIGASLNPDSGVTEFAVATNTTTSFAGTGEWSWLQFARGQSPNVVPSKGIPIIRSNTPAGPGALRFADPSDFYGVPSRDYALMHAGPNQRILFPRPKVEADGRNEVSSTTVPQIADPYALSTSLGPFPSFDFCIPFEVVPAGGSPSYRLSIGTDGSLRLVLPSSTFTAPKDQRVIFESPDLSTIVYTQGTAITLTIDSAASPSFTFEMRNLALATETTDSGTKQELQRVVGDLICSSTGLAELRNTQLVFGPPLQPMKDVLSFMKTLGITPPLQLSMTNEWSSYWWMEADLARLEKLLQGVGAAPPPGSNVVLDFIKKFVPELSFKIENNTKMTAVLQEMKARVVVKIPKAIIGLLDVLLTAIFNMTTAVAITDPTRKTIEGGVGGGVGFSQDFAIGTLEASALLTFSYIRNLASGSWGIAAGLRLKGELILGSGDLKGIFSISVSAEMKGILLAVECKRPRNDPAGTPQPVTQWGVFQATLAVELHILFVIDVGCEIQYQTETQLSEGVCGWEEFGQIT